MEIKEKKLTIKEFYTALRAGEISIDENGHDPFYGWGPTNMIDSLERKINFWDNESGYSKRTNSKWSDEFIGDSHDNSKHIREIERDSPCSKCGNTLSWIYDSSTNSIKCVETELISSGPVSTWYYKYQEGLCTETETPVEFNFEVKDDIIFSNFFRHQMELSDTEEKNQKYDYFGLNTSAGRRKLTEFYASLNIGFQQTTNCSVDLYINKKKTELLIIKDSYIYDEETETEYEAYSEISRLGYDHLGDISCSMWRYMFINERDFKEDPSKDIDEDDLIRVKLEKGTYSVINYYDSKEHNNHKIGKFNIAARIKLK